MSFAMDGIELDSDCMDILNKIRTARPALELMTSYKIGQLSPADLLAKARDAQQRIARNALRVGNAAGQGRGGRGGRGKGGKGDRRSSQTHLSDALRDTRIVDMALLDEFDSDDEDINMMRDWINRFPDLPDPMLELERYTKIILYFVCVYIHLCIKFDF